MIDIATQILNCIEQETIRDGGPGSGRKKGSKNKNRQMQKNLKVFNRNVGTLPYTNATTERMTFTPQEKYRMGQKRMQQIKGSSAISEDPHEAAKGYRDMRYSAHLNAKVSKEHADALREMQKEDPEYMGSAEETENKIQGRERNANAWRKVASGLDAKPNYSIGNMASLILNTFNNNGVADGGEGSGNFGHGGRKGYVGGSSDVQNDNTPILNESEKTKVASTLDTITKVLNKNKAYFKGNAGWDTEAHFDEALSEVRDTINDNDVHVGVSGSYNALNVRITLKDKNVTIKYDDSVRGKKWSSNKDGLVKLVNITNKTASDKCVGDGGPGSGRKRGSRNRNNAIATAEANERNSEKAKQKIMQKYAHQQASAETFNKREQELDKVRAKGQSTTRAIRNASKHGTKLTPINAVDAMPNDIVSWIFTNVVGEKVADGGPGSGNFGHAGREGKQGGSAPSNSGGNKNGKVGKIMSHENEIADAIEKGRLSLPDGWSPREIAQVHSVMEAVIEGFNNSYDELRYSWSSFENRENADELEETDISDRTVDLESELLDRTGQMVYVTSDEKGTYLEMYGSDEHPIEPSKYIRIPDDETKWPSIDTEDVKDMVDFVSKNECTKSDYKRAYSSYS